MSTCFGATVEEIVSALEEGFTSRNVLDALIERGLYSEEDHRASYAPAMRIRCHLKRLGYSCPQPKVLPYKYYTTPAQRA